MPPIDHWMQFATFKQKNYFEYPEKSTYKGIVINGNMAAHAPAGLAAFLLEKTASANYIIDPLTHAFQHDPKLISNQDGQPKTSLQKIAEIFGTPVSDTIGVRPVIPVDFTDDNTQEFVQNCLDFQRTQIVAYMKESAASKYLEDGDLRPPQILVSPYFYMTEATYKEWLTVNIDLANHSRMYCTSPENMYVALVISQDILLNEEVRNAVIDAYKKLPANGYLVWIDGLDECNSGTTLLRALSSLCSELRGSPQERDVLNLHGGYFSVLAAGELGRHAMTGVSHGPEFGEYRAVVPVGGGIPIARYYIPDLHMRTRFRDALRFFTGKGWLDSAELFHENVCHCEVCVETLAGKPENFLLFGEATVKNVKRKHGHARIEFPTKEATERCLKHYLQIKKSEYELVGSANSKELLDNLESGFEKYKDVAGMDAISHLRIWQSVFRSI